MPNLNIPLDASLLREVNYHADKAGMTQRDWVIWVLAVNVGWESEKGPLTEIQRERNGKGKVAVQGRGENNSSKRVGVKSAIKPEGSGHSTSGVHGSSVVEEDVVTSEPIPEFITGYSLSQDEKDNLEYMDSIETHDCPACDTRLVFWTKPGPYKGQWACPECDRAYTAERLKKLGK